MSIDLNLIAFIWKTITYLSPVPLLLLTYRKYRHWSHLGMMLANLFLWFSSILGYIVDTSPQPTEFLEPYWAGANILLYLSILILLLSVLLAQFDRLPGFSHLITLLFGILSGLILDLDNMELVEDGSGGLSSSYSPSISILGLMGMIVFIIFTLNPLIKKMISKKFDKSKSSYLILLIGYSILIFWVISLLFTDFEAIRISRRFTFSLGMFLWSIAVMLDPLIIVITRSTVQKAIILTKTGLPLFSHNFETDKEMDSSLLAGVITAIKTSLESMITSGTMLQSMQFEHSVLSFINGEHTVLIILSDDKISSNLRLISNIFMQKFKDKHSDAFDRDDLELGQFKGTKQLLEEITNRVLI